jgi:hypothetical protein
MYCTGLVINETDLSKDEKALAIYKKYLGSDYKAKDFYTTIISNHCSWAEILYLAQKHSPSLIGKSSVKKVPIVSFIGIAMNAIFIDRTSKESRADTVIIL